MHKLAFLILPEFSHLGLAAAIEPLFIANWLAQTPLFSWKIVSADGRSVRASNGMGADADGDLKAADDCETVFVLASFDTLKSARQQQVLRWLRRIGRFGVEIGGIENGSIALAEAGLLGGHIAAVHWDNLSGFQERYPAVRAVPHLYNFSDGRITCAGASAILDMMVAWIGRNGEADLASEVAEHLLIAHSRASSTERKPHGDSLPQVFDQIVERAQTIMRDNIDEPLSCEDIAGRVGLSLRQIERRFKRELGFTVSQQYTLLRVAKAHQLLQQTELSVTAVAFACGFPSPEYFSRVYKRSLGVAPSSQRQQSTAAPVLRLKRRRSAG